MTTKPRTEPHKSELRPLPMRITQLQFERLHAARSRDGLSVQEHVRRALDHYLGKVEKDLPKVAGLGEDQPVVASQVNGQPPLSANSLESLHPIGFSQPGVTGPARNPAPRIRSR